MKGSATLTPIVAGAFVTALIILMYAVNLNLMSSIAIAILVAGITAGLTGSPKIAMYLILGGVVFGLILTQTDLLTTGITEGTAVTAGTFAVTPATVTAGTSLSGTTFTIPETYNSTAKTVSKDTFEVSFDITRTDESVEDATCVVTIDGIPTVTDTATSLEYQIVEKDTLQQYKIYVNDSSSNIQTLSRTLPFKFGTTDSYTVRVKYDMNGASFAYADTYASLLSTIDVCGTKYIVNIQKTATVA